MTREGITFDDVLLMPRKSRVFSRKDINTKTQLSRNIALNIPIVSANMDTVTEARMARAMAEAGGIGIIHRFLSIERQVEEVRKVKRAESVIIDDPITVETHNTLGDIRTLLNKESISGALVTKGWGAKKKLLGIVTTRDLIFEDDINKKVKFVMTKDLITASPNISLKQAKELLHKNKIEKLPLVNNKGMLVGLITLKDILKKINNPHSAKDSKGRLLVGAAVGVKDDTLKRTEALLGAGTDVIVIDIAHGHNVRVLETVALLKKTFGTSIEIIAGNIATTEAAKDLIRAGVDGLKVGIGPGAACTTRVVTGVGVPQLTAIQDVLKVARKANIPVNADGGVKNSGDFSKALAAGASSVMMGSLLAGCKESPGEYVMDRGVAYKFYRGMASHEAGTEKIKIDGLSAGGDAQAGEADGFTRSPEGASGKIPFKGDAGMVLSDLIAGLRSSMSYLGAHTLSEFHKNAQFIRMTPAGALESRPHGVSGE